METSRARSASASIQREKLSRSFDGGIASALARHFKGLALTLFVLAVAYALYCAAGLYSVATTTGVISETGVQRAVRIARDARGVPHVRAASSDDVYFGEGFAQASDRLAQMDLLRRYAYGRTAEIAGPIQLRLDVAMRYLDIRDIAQRQWRHLPPGDRAALQAFSKGVNCAMRTQPLPFEFRALLYHPQPWTPQDSLAVMIAVSASLDDSVTNVLSRDALWHTLAPRDFDSALPLSDPRYDVAYDGGMYRGAPPTRSPLPLRTAIYRVKVNARGSNAWAAGGAHSVDGSALLANDPHLDVSIPGIWYIVEMQSPGLHVAGVTIPGIPGVILGHNESLAWGATNAMSSSVSVFRIGSMNDRMWVEERFRVRFGRDVRKRFYRTPREFAIPVGGGRFALVRWPQYADSRSPVSTVLRLDRAKSIRDAMQSLAHYGGPAQNFFIADSHGVVAYHVAGAIPEDPAWGRFVHSASDLVHTYADIPFQALPSAQPSRSAVFLNANNKMYRPGYPYRLSAMFAPPYRAYRIAQLLGMQRRYDATYFARMQLDVTSPADAEFAHLFASYAGLHPGFLDRKTIEALKSWNGSYTPESTIASTVHAFRIQAESFNPSPYAALALVRHPDAASDMEILRSVDPQTTPWSKEGMVPLAHPLGTSGLSFLNAAALPGDGDEYTVHVQTRDLTQSFRAVWDVGHWDSGGISVPAGVSGEFASPHYDDQRANWISGRLGPLPFSEAAVAASTRAVLTLKP